MRRQQHAQIIFRRDFRQNVGERVVGFASH
jgi:hypothetical protein